jgi:sRNA-binding protein
LLFVGEAAEVEAGDQVRIAHQLLDRDRERLRHLLHDRVALGVDGGRIQGMVATAHAEEARRQLEGFRAEARDLRRALREAKAPWVSRCSTTARASLSERPETRRRSDAEAVLSSTPTWLTAPSTAVPSSRSSDF